MVCKNTVGLKDPIQHTVVTQAPEKVYMIRNHLGKYIKIGLFVNSKTGQKFRALLPSDYECQ